MSLRTFIVLSLSGCASGLEVQSAITNKRLNQKSNRYKDEINDESPLDIYLSDSKRKHEYDEFKEDVLVEDNFMELNDKRVPVRQVILGITNRNFVVAKQFKDHNSKATVAKEPGAGINRAEIDWIVPISEVKISEIADKIFGTILKVKSCTGRCRYFTMSNVGGNFNDRWAHWTKQSKSCFQMNVSPEHGDENKGKMDVSSVKEAPELSKKRSCLKQVSNLQDGINTNSSGVLEKQSIPKVSFVKNAPGLREGQKSLEPVGNFQDVRSIKDASGFQENESHSVSVGSFPKKVNNSIERITKALHLSTERLPQLPAMRGLSKSMSSLSPKRKQSSMHQILDKTTSFVSVVKCGLFKSSANNMNNATQTDPRIVKELRDVAVQVDLPRRKKKKCPLNCFRPNYE